MAVKRKASRVEKPKSQDIESIINRGGTTSSESDVSTDDEVKFTLRIPAKMTAKIDKDRKNMIGNVSRNQWILEAIDKKLK